MADTLFADEEVLVPDLPAPLAGAIAAGPYNFEFTGEDRLRLTVHNSQPSTVVGVHYRMKPRRGPIHPTAQGFTPASDRTASSVEFSIGEGYLLNVTAFATSGSPRIGQTFVTLDVIRGGGASAIVLGTILQDYVTARQPIAWPGSPLRSSIEGGGVVRFITGTDPAAGVSGVSEIVPTGARWEVLAFGVEFITSAVGGDRNIWLRFADPVIPYIYIPSIRAQTASQDWTHTFAQGLMLDTLNKVPWFAQGAPANLVLPAGHEIAVFAQGAQAGDDFAAPRYTVREWLEAQ